MAGLTNLLNIGKVGLLAQQTSLQTIGHNISNVNTPGYSRQDVELSANDPTPTFIGPIGNGVEATDIVRAYDRFITQTLFSKMSDKSGLEARVSGMEIVEGALNEVEENGINGMLEDFWNGWDDLANNAEGMAERTTLIERATALADALRDKHDTLLKLSKDINLNIDSSIKDINQITSQIAELNVQIVAAEAGHHSANDLRDQRDQLVNRLSQLANIHYFETERGSYTVLIGQGSPLVEDNQSWKLEMQNGKVNWLGSNGQKFELTTRDISGGELGGWLDIKKRLEPRDPTQLVGSMANTSGGSPIRESTRWDAIDGVSVTGDFTIEFSGTDQEGNPVGPVTFQYTSPPAESNATVGDFLSAIESAYSNVEASITEDGRIKIEDMNPGSEPISFQIEGISGGITGLNLGKFDGSYPLSYIEKLNQIGKQLIKYVNGQHSQGVGLIPLQETSAANRVTSETTAISSRASGLEFSDVVQTGFFEIYLYDSQGNPIDADNTTIINEPYRINITEGNTTLEDIRDDINNNIPDLNARIVDNRLVIGVDGPPATAAGFAFGKDTSGALTALGMNAFFTGEDASSIGINEKLREDPRLIAAGQVEGYGASSALSHKAVMDENRALDATIGNGTVRVQLFDVDGNVADSVDINIDRDNDSLADILDEMNEIDGIRAYVEDDLVHVETEKSGYTVSIDDSASGVDTGFLEFFGMGGGPASRIDGNLKVERTFDVLSSYDTGVTAGNSFSIDILDENGNILNSPAPTFTVNINAGDSLADIASAIDANDNISAQIVNGKLAISVQGQGDKFYVRDDATGLFSFLDMSVPNGGLLSPASNVNALSMRDLNRRPIADLDDATLSQAYQGLVGTVGIHTRTFNLDLDFAKGAVSDLQAKREDVSGVSIDEELSDLLRFQHAYTAAAKLIKAADEMFLSLLNAKQ